VAENTLLSMDRTTVAEPVLKHVPGDFLVRENVVVDLVDEKAATHQYSLLRKSGYTTMEAVRLLADRLALAARDITYAGLKDEDGITEQLVALPAGHLPARRFWRDAERWLELLPYGLGDGPLEIGRLEGNGFRVTLRDLSPAEAATLSAARKINLLFLNFYDTQRFGVPGGPKLTHVLGGALLDEDWHTALSVLIGLDAPESGLAADWRGTARDFFAALDPRTTSFYLAAHASAQWNADLADVVAHACPQQHIDIELDGMDYRYVDSDDAAAAVLGAARELPFTKYAFRDGAVTSRLSPRPTVVQTTVEVGADTPDPYFPGRCAVPLSFFLPSGSYATGAIRQLALRFRAGER